MVAEAEALRRRVVRAARRAAVRPVRRLRGRPPIASRHWPAAPPDFVGVGAQRSGTSWWYSLVESHPSVQTLAAATKELHYFDRFWGEPFTEEDVGAYARLFRRPPGKVGGEWTPRYMYDPWTPPLLRRAAPDARLLVLLRDPVDRFVSAMNHRAERGRRIDASAVGEAVSRGLYHAQLTRLLAHFPRQQVLVLQFEQCRDDVDAMLRRTFAFLGLPETVPPPARRHPANQSRPLRSGHAGRHRPAELPRVLLDEIRTGYRADVDRLAGAFPDIDLDRWENFAHLL